MNFLLNWENRVRLNLDTVLDCVIAEYFTKRLLNVLESHSNGVGEAIRNCSILIYELSVI